MDLSRAWIKQETVGPNHIILIFDLRAPGISKEHNDTSEMSNTNDKGDYC